MKATVLGALMAQFGRVFGGKVMAIYLKTAGIAFSLVSAWAALIQLIA